MGHVAPHHGDLQQPLGSCRTRCPISTAAPRYSRGVLAQRPALVLQHLLRPVDVVEPVGVHRHQDAADVRLRDNEAWGCATGRTKTPRKP